jgi:hypothetical protein
MTGEERAVRMECRRAMLLEGVLFVRRQLMEDVRR